MDNFFAQNDQMGQMAKIVQYQHGYFGPPTQFCPFLIQGLLNFESAKKIKERRSQRSASFESAARALK